MSKARGLFGIVTVLSMMVMAAALWLGPAQTVGASGPSVGNNAIPEPNATRGKMTWYSPHEWITGEPSLNVSYPQFAHPDTAITSAQQGAGRWVYLSLPLPSGTKVDAVTVCYDLDEPTTFISQTRLTDMKTPDFATVVFDDPTDQTSTTPTCYSLKTKVVTQNGLALQLLLDIKGDNKAAIHLGSVGVLSH